MKQIAPSLRLMFKPLAAAAILAFAPALASCGVAEAQTGAAPAEGSSQALLETAPETAPKIEPNTETVSSRQCFFARQVTGFRNAVDEDGQRVDTRVLIDVGARDTYEFELLRRCPALRFARSIALERTGPGRICDGLDVDLIVNDTLSPDRCRVTMVRKLSADEADARAGAED